MYQTAGLIQTCEQNMKKTVLVSWESQRVDLGLTTASLPWLSWQSWTDIFCELCAGSLFK